jgi:hypothetical protein
VPKTVLVTTRTAMERGGVSYPAGARLPVPIIDALTLKRRGVVTLTRKAAAAPEAVDPPPPPVSRRRYRRRDLQAEETTTVEINPSPPPVASTPDSPQPVLAPAPAPPDEEG